MTTTPERTATLTDLVAAEVRALLGRLDVRPAELARRMGENDQWLSSRLKGRTPIDVNELQRIARALGVGIHELMPTPEEAARAAVPVKKGSPALKEPFRPRARSAKSMRHEDLPASPVGSGRVDLRRPESAVGLSHRRPQLLRRDDRRPRSA